MQPDLPGLLRESRRRSAPTHRSLEQIEFMLDCVVRNEGEPDVVQISGGEPTIHPSSSQILDAAQAPADQAPDGQHQRRADRAATPSFAERLADVHAGLRDLSAVRFARAPSRIATLRGARPADVQLQALERLNEHDISTTLVVTLKKGLNDDEIGDDHRLRAEAALRPRRDVPADPGRRPRPKISTRRATG